MRGRDEIHVCNSIWSRTNPYALVRAGVENGKQFGVHARETGDLDCPLPKIEGPSVHNPPLQLNYGGISAN